MRSDLDRIEALLGLKSLRQRAAEAELAAARGVEAEAEAAQRAAQQKLDATAAAAHDVRRARLEAVFAARDGHELYNGLALFAHLATEAEIAAARQAVARSAAALGAVASRSAAARGEFSRRTGERERCALMKSSLTEAARHHRSGRCELR
jgi:hypothetical protein